MKKNNTAYRGDTLKPFGNDELIQMQVKIGRYVISLCADKEGMDYYSVHNINGHKIPRSFSGEGSYYTACLFAIALDAGMQGQQPEYFANICGASLIHLTKP